MDFTHVNILSVNFGKQNGMYVMSPMVKLINKSKANVIKTGFYALLHHIENY
jgi:hypothetical protein